MSVLVAVTRVSDPLMILEFVTLGRSPTLPSGAVRVSENSGAWFREPTPENLLAEARKACVFGSAPVSVRVVDRKDVPVLYKEARVDNGLAITHDMVKAKEIHLDILRSDRAKLFEQLDGEWMRAMGQKKSAEADAIEAHREILRNITTDPRIAAALTIEDLTQIKAE